MQRADSQRNLFVQRSPVLAIGQHDVAAAEVLRVGKVLGLWRPRPDAGDEDAT
jgi:hypothetical protein